MYIFARKLIFLEIDNRIAFGSIEELNLSQNTTNLSKISIKKIYKDFENKKKLNKKFNLGFFENYSTNELVSISDLVLYSMSTIGYEVLFRDVLSVRIVDKSMPPFFNDEDNLPFIDNYSALDDILNERLKLNFNKKDFHNIKKRNFFKIDKKAYLRFWDLMKRYE